MGTGNHDPSIPSHCEIRDLRIKDPFYTYCSNHPYRMQRRVEVPLGPVYVHVDESFERDGVTHYDSGRRVWIDAPDTEEVRVQLLELLADPDNLSDSYPFYGANLLGVVVDECERLREPRAIPILERIGREFHGDPEVRQEVRQRIEDAIARIEKSVRGAREAPGD